MGDRRNLHARLSPEAYGRLVAWCDENGVSVTSILEAAALHVGVDQVFTDQLVRLIPEARRIAASRRRG